MPAWYLGCFPDNRIILTSYEAHFARQWGRKVRNILNEHGEQYFGVKLERDNRSASEWSIANHSGSMQTAGAGGALTGKGAHCLIVDDPIKNAEQARSARQLDALWDWWESTVVTRLEPGGIAIVIATRWNERDPSGRLIAAVTDGTGEPITRIRLPALAEDDDPLGRSAGEALWPERFTRERLEQMREGKSAYWWNALYQQRPTQHEGAEWPEEYFSPHLLTDEWPSVFEISAIMLDPSKGKTDRSDYSALVFAGLSSDKIWVDCNIARRPISKMISDGFWFWQTHPSDAFGVEANAFQELLAPEFDRIARDLGVPPLPIHLIENFVNKEVRINRLGPFLHRRQIRIRNNEGGRLLVRQLKEHPIGDHDDGPDALEGAIRLISLLGNARLQSQADEWEIANV